jgi:hypothetical protein
MDGHDSSTSTRMAKFSRHDTYSEKKSLLLESREGDARSGPNSQSDGMSAHKDSESGVVRRSLKIRPREQHGSSDNSPLLLAEQGNDERSKSGQKTKTAQGASGREPPSSAMPMFRAIPSASSNASANSPTAPHKSADRHHRRHRNALQSTSPGDHTKELRALMCGSQDAAEIDRCIRSVFEARLDANGTAEMLRAMTTPAVENINDHVNEVYFNTAANLYKKYSDKDLAGKLKYAEEKYAKSKKYYRVRQHLLNVIYKKLTLEDRRILKETSFKAYDAAAKSGLSALHAAIRSGNATAVRAYIKAVLKYAPQDQAVSLLEMKDRYGRSAFYTAMMSGTPEVIRAYMNSIIPAKINRETKFDIFHAKRNDGTGAFYLTMGTGNKERAAVFIGIILCWGNISSDEQAYMLRGEHDNGKLLKSATNPRIYELRRSPYICRKGRKYWFPGVARGLAASMKKNEAVAMFDQMIKDAPFLDNDARRWLRSNT